jgi:glyceraldehyde 3-phosphate dehydrogenase
MEQIKIAINGFGRIGRAAFKIALEKPELRILALNDLTDPQSLASLLRYDSVYGVFRHKVDFDLKPEKAGQNIYSAGSLIVNGKRIPVFAEKDPAMLPWKDLGIDVVLESTGRFTSSEKASAHLKAGAKKVIISAPAKDPENTPTIIIGINDKDYQGQNIISNASCTTNCITPVAFILEKNFKILKMMMSTIHSYTAEQNLIDGPPPPLHKDMRRARAAALNIVPTTTGATIAATEVLPSIKGLFGGMAFRVPTPCGSLSDFTAIVGKKVTVGQVNNAFIEAANDPKWRGIMTATKEPIVSTDIIGNPHSTIVDLSLTQVVDGDMVKVVAWYDNEFGYANRFVEQAILIGNR